LRTSSRLANCFGASSLASTGAPPLSVFPPDLHSQLDPGVGVVGQDLSGFFSHSGQGGAIPHPTLPNTFVRIGRTPLKELKAGIEAEIRRRSRGDEKGPDESAVHIQKILQSMDKPARKGAISKEIEEESELHGEEAEIFEKGRSAARGQMEELREEGLL
jgi:hypothetical protein